MLMWSAVAAAVGMQLAEPKGSPGTWMTDQDYPSTAFRRNAQGQTRFRLLVTPDGKPVRCAVVTSSGHTDLDQQTCALMIHRAEFSPATDADGQAIYGTFTSIGIWQLPGVPFAPKEPASDLELFVAALPKSVKAPARIRVGLLIGPDGTVQNCKTNKIDNSSIILAPTACKHAVASIQLKPVVDEQNRPLISVQDVEVRFSVAR